MKSMNKLLTLFKGIKLFKDWPKWLLWRFLPKARGSNPDTFRLRDGTVFTFRPKDASGAGMFQEMYLQGGYDYEPKRGDVVIDIGAHIGVFSIKTARKNVNVKILAYEPNPVLHSFLVDNIHKNDLSGLITAHCLAVAKSPGERKFWGQTMIYEATKHPITKQMTDEKPISVRATTLPDIFTVHKIERCDFLKMDCEGAEFEIILNTPSKVLRKISKMEIEYHFDPQPLLDYIREKGFKITTGKVLSNNLGHFIAIKK